MSSELGGIIVTMGTGVVIAPFLIHRLGESIYGLWILIAALTGYFGLLTWASAVGRPVHRLPSRHRISTR
jgi:O-antigen/teichoic acid export membrane protein